MVKFFSISVGYLLKPFSFERFLQAVKRANELLNFNIQNDIADDSKHLFIRADFSMVKVAIDNIIYIEALDDYIKINIQDQKTLVARMTMKGILEKLPSNKFVRIHRSFIVAIDRIKNIRTKTILVDRIEIPLGGNYKERLKEIFGK